MRLVGFLAKNAIASCPVPGADIAGAARYPAFRCTCSFQVRHLVAGAWALAPDSRKASSCLQHPTPVAFVFLLRRLRIPTGAISRTTRGPIPPVELADPIPTAALAPPPART